jgi:hypothetical protein
LAADLVGRAQYAHHRRKEGRKDKEAIDFASCLPLSPIPSSNLLVSDFLRGSYSHISGVKNAEPNYYT